MSTQFPADTYSGSVDPQAFTEKLTFQDDAGMLLDWAISPLMVSPNSLGIYVKPGETHTVTEFTEENQTQ